MFTKGLSSFTDPSIVRFAIEVLPFWVWEYASHAKASFLGSGEDHGRSGYERWGIMAESGVENSGNVRNRGIGGVFVH